MMQQFDFGSAQIDSTPRALVAAMPGTAGMVTLIEGPTLAFPISEMKAREKKCGTPTAVLFIELSDAVTLPNPRPRNSP